MQSVSLYRLTWLAAALSLGHHLDHLVRHNAVGWPLTDEVNAFTTSLVVYPIIATGLLLYRAGWVGPGFWRWCRAAVRDPAFQDQLQRPRRAALPTGVLDAPAVAREAVEDLPVSPDRHAVLDPAVASPATATPKRHPKRGKELSLPSR